MAGLCKEAAMMIIDPENTDISLPHTTQVRPGGPEMGRVQARCVVRRAQWPDRGDWLPVRTELC